MTYRDRLDYIRRTFAPEPDELRRLRESLTDKNDQITIAPEDGKLLQMLLRLIAARTVVEIGTLAGYSALWMEKALPDDGFLITIEKDAARAKRARENFKDHPKIRLMEGDARALLPQIAPEGPFDMVFIDADKLNYLHYLDWAEENVRKGGLIVADNTLLFDAVWSETIPDNVRPTALDAMREFNRRLADPERYASVLLPTPGGLTLALKR